MRHKNTLTILLCSLTLISCGQTETKKRTDEVKVNKEVEKKYTKVISDPTNKLTDKVENLEIEYTIWSCACPQWTKSKDLKIYDTTVKFIDKHFYIEPADSTLKIPIYFQPYRHKVKVIGQFYEREDYPKGTIEMEDPMPKAKVFRYTKIEVINNSNFKPDSKVETLTLIYNAISCTCAQWSETRLSNDPDKKTNYWLEPANNKLMKAETLFNGENLPLMIKVTGQVVTENGFPKSELAKVGQDKAGKVFRYTKIEVIQNGQNKNGR